MKILILSNVMVMGTAVFIKQNKGTDKKPVLVPTVIELDKKLAIELIRSKQAKEAPKNAEVNFGVKPLDQEEDELDDFFDDEEIEPEE